MLRPGPLGTKVLIIGGGGIGAEVADHLSETGKEVTLVEMKEGNRPGPGRSPPALLESERLKKKGVRILSFDEGGSLRRRRALDRRPSGNPEN